MYICVWKHACMYVVGCWVGCGCSQASSQLLNPSNDNYSCHPNSATCYQFVQSLLKIGSALAERVGHRKEKSWSAPGGSFFCFVAQTGVENAPCTLLGILYNFQSGEVFSGRRALTMECLLMSGCSEDHALALENSWWPKFLGLTSSESQSTGQRKCD